MAVALHYFVKPYHDGKVKGLSERGRLYCRRIGYSKALLEKGLIETVDVIRGEACLSNVVPSLDCGNEQKTARVYAPHLETKLSGVCNPVFLAMVEGA